jgi:hypothetical protein
LFLDLDKTFLAESVTAIQVARHSWNIVEKFVTGWTLHVLRFKLMRNSIILNYKLRMNKLKHKINLTYWHNLTHKTILLTTLNQYINI